MQGTFASYISTLRKAKGMTQKELAKRLDFTPQGISRFEAVDSSFNLRLIDKLCKELDISFNELCQGKTEDTHYEEFDLDLDNLHSRMKIQRERKGLTQATLAEKARITARSLRLYESGESLPSFQTLSGLAEALDISVYDFFIPIEEEEAIPLVPPEIVNPVRHRGLGKAAIIPISVFSFLLLALGIGLPLGLTLSTPKGENIADGPIGDSLPVDIVETPSLPMDVMEEPSLPTDVVEEPSLPTDVVETPSFTEEVTEAASAPAPYLPSFTPIQEYPNFLSVDIPHNDFSAPGEEIEFTLYDPDAHFSLFGLKEEDISLTLNQEDERSSLDVEFLYRGDGRFVAKLKGGKTGGLVFVDAFLGGRDFLSITYFRYATGETVYPVYGSPFDDGVVTGSNSIDLPRQTEATGKIFLTIDGDPVSVHDGTWIDLKTFPAAADDIDCGIGMRIEGNKFTILFSSPEKVPYDDVLAIVGFTIKEEDGAERAFFLKPWKLHLQR